jgi:four helix bundle protein
VIRNYRDLVGWQRAMDVAVVVYEVSGSCPKEELYGIVSQMRRSAVSVPSNIAEGQGRRSDGDFLRHLAIANGSRCELETQAILAGRLGFLDQSQVDRVLEGTAEVGRLINGLINSISSNLESKSGE